ncbi:tetratricopeptide repeat protein [Fulvivirga sediminis]|uniref:Tetratricopeptide repeat protein n=1 Tax=Fulvivirga sediminis TaxID=2803949 RepID=A0A937FDG5_9BACT|nr:tetratricopeptide repeat protein [Fulvivirga sediminis]MBL3658398.1 tetratricopeptide repeat protein [Fulvivirga sediminis]
MSSCTDKEITNSKELPEDVHSLELMLENDQLEVNQKMALYYELSKKYRTDDIELADNYIDKLISLSEQANSKYFQARGHYMKGMLSRQMGFYQQGVNHYIISSDLFSELNNNLWKADALNNIGDVFYNIQGYDLALPYFQKASLIYENEKDWNNLSLVCSNIATCNNKLNKEEEANSYFKKAIDAQSKMDEPSGIILSKIYRELANMSHDLENYTQSISYYEKALSFPGITTDQEHLLFVNTANALNLKGDFEESENWLKKAKQLENRVDNNHKLLRLNVEGELYQLQKQHSKAIAIFNEAVNATNKEVYNEYLINTLDLISKSQRAMAKESAKLSINDIFRIEDIRRHQEKLKAEVIDQLDYKKLQVLLDTEIQNHYKDVKQSEIDKERSTIIKIASACIAIFFFTMLGTTLYIRSKKVTYENKIRRVNDLLNS